MEIAASKAPGELLNWGDIQTMKLSWRVLDDAGAVDIQSGTGSHELPWLQNPQIMEGATAHKTYFKTV